jgi:hypothetical protein
MSLIKPTFSAAFVRNNSTNVGIYLCTCAFTQEKSPISANIVLKDSQPSEIVMTTNEGTQTRNPTCVMHVV